MTAGIPTCPSCQYELRGLPLRGRCPECGSDYVMSLPGLEPGRLPPTQRYQRFSYEAGLSRRAQLKGVILCLVGVGIVMAWKASGDGAHAGPTEAVNYLTRYGITLAAALGIYFALCSMSIVEFAGPLSRVLFGVAGALAGADLAHHIVYSIGGWALLGVPWFIGFVVYVGLTADLLDIDLTEAGLFGILTLATRIILKFALFDPMFAA